MRLTRDDAIELIWLNNGEGNARITKVDDVSLGHSRWMDLRKLIVKDEFDRLWAADYEIGLTELQDDPPPWDGEESVNFYQVEAVAVTTYEYVRL